MKRTALAVLAAAAGIGVVTDAAAQAAIGWSGSARVREEDREFKVNGRVQYDVYAIDADYNTGGGTDFQRSGAFARRVFLGAEGRFTSNWRYNIKFDLSPGQPNDVSVTTGSVRNSADTGSTTAVTAVSNNSGVGNEVRLDDFFLEYAGSNYSIFIGQNNAVSHMEDRTSSNYTQFNERSSFDNAFGFGKIFGVSFLTNGGNWSLGFGVQTDKLDGPESSDEEPLAYTGRATYAPIYQRTPDGISFLHLGASARWRDNGSGASTFTYTARPGAASSGAGYSSGSSVTTGGASRDVFYGLEAAYQYNNFGAAAEYARLEATYPGVAPDRSFDGGYAELYWSPTGEGRNYGAGDGSWGRITPRRTLGNDGGIGHVMLQLRYDWLNLNDGATLGGEQTGYLAGLTWAPIAYVKFQLNYSKYEVEKKTAAGAAAAGDGDVDAVSLRTQFDF